MISRTHAWAERHETDMCLAVVVLLLCLSFVSIVFFLDRRAHQFPNDAFYYLSLADGVRETGRLVETTTVPVRPVLTPQNGVVAVHLALGPFTRSAEQSLRAVVWLNFLLLWLSVFPLWRLMRLAGVWEVWPQLALLSIYVTAWHVMRIVLAPINDGIWYSGSMWLLWLLAGPAGGESGDVRPRWRVGAIAACVLLSAVLVHFRLTTLVYGIAAAATGLLVRRSRLVWLGAAMTVIMAASLALVYSHVRIGGMEEAIEIGDDSPLFLAIRGVWITGTRTVPQALFRDLGTTANLLYAPFALALAWGAWEGIRKGLAVPILSALSVLGILALVILFPVKVYRYAIGTVPLLYILALRWRITRTIGYLFCFVVFMSSFFVYFDGWVRGDRLGRPDRDLFWFHVQDEGIDVQQGDALVLSENTRYPYYYLGLRGALDAEYEWADVHRAGVVYVIGPAEFRGPHIQRIADMCRERRVQCEQHNLTWEYSDPEGNAITQIRVMTDADHTPERSAGRAGPASAFD